MKQFDNIRCPNSRPHKRKIKGHQVHEDSCDQLGRFVSIDTVGTFVYRCPSCKRLIQLDYKDGMATTMVLPSGFKLDTRDGLVVVNEHI